MPNNACNDIQKHLEKRRKKYAHTKNYPSDIWYCYLYENVL